MPTSITQREPRASRRSRMRAISSTTSSGVLRRLARLCAWLADSGSSIACAPESIARSAPFRFGTSTEAVRPGSVSACATSSAVSASCGISLGGTNEPTSISRRPASYARAQPLQLVFGGQRARQDLQPVAQADFAHGHRCAGFEGVGVMATHS